MPASDTKQTFDIAALAGDGIGKEVTAACLEPLQAARSVCGAPAPRCTVT